MLRAEALAVGTRSLTLQLPVDVWRYTLHEREANPGARRIALKNFPQTTRMTTLTLILSLLSTVLHPLTLLLMAELSPLVRSLRKHRIALSLVLAL